MSKEKIMYLRIRNICGLLGVLLPWMALFSGSLLASHPSEEWWWSLSATYYLSPALVGVLTPACIVLMSYEGYDKLDDRITTLSGVFGLGIVLFPTQVAWLPADMPVGFFQLPAPLSNFLHALFSGLFFLFLAFNSFYLFTKTGGEKMTRRKQLRNIIYRTCGAGMLLLEVVYVILTLCDVPGYYVMILEILLLHLFGISWLVKGEAIPWLNDKEEKRKCTCHCHDDE